MRAEAESEESPPPDNEELNEEEDDEEETVEMTPPFEDSSDDENEEEARPVGPVSWLKEKIRRKSKEELEAEQAEKSAEALEVCAIRLPVLYRESGLQDFVCRIP